MHRYDKVARDDTLEATTPQASQERSNRPPNSLVLIFFYILVLVVVTIVSVRALSPIAKMPRFRSRPEVVASNHVHLESTLAEHVNPAAAAANRYLVFHAPTFGQGIGNMLTGLQGAHAIANYYNRSLCIDWPSFNRVFTYPSKKLCEDVLAHRDKLTTSRITIVNWNHFHGRNAEVDRKLAESSQLVEMSGNFYPLWWEHDGGLLRWEYTRYFPPRFYELYTPSANLSEKLPAHFPETVVHLRMGDGGRECRPPFCTVSARLWKQLSTCLPKNGYLLSDRQDPYDHLGSLKHPPKRIAHSAFGQLSDSDELEMWAEWLILLHATTTVHTHSEFSESAVRWARGTNANFEIGAIDPVTEMMKVVSGVDNLVPPVANLSDAQIKMLKLREHQATKWHCSST